MNFRYLYFTLCLFFTSYFSLYGQLEFIIDGSVDNSVLPNSAHAIKDGDIVLLSFINSNRIDTAIVNSNTFKFKGTVDIPSVAMLEYNSGGLLILIDSSEYAVSLAISEVAPDKYGYNNTSISTESFFFNLWKSLTASSGKLKKQKKELQNLISNSPTVSDRIIYETELQGIDNKLRNIYYDASKKYYGSYEMSYLLPGAPDFSYQRYIGFYNDLPLEVKNSFYGKNLYERLVLTKP